MNIILIGMNHKTAPLEIRERLTLACAEGVDPIAEIMKIPQIEEALYLATCNRVEVVAKTADAAESIERLKDFIFRQGNLAAEELEQYLYLYRDHEAVRHLFRVTASLDSLVMGEPQILGQVKDAFRKTVENNASGIILNKILHHAFRTAKRVRTETEIAENAVSVSYAAVELAKKIFGSLEGKTILIVGAGEMSELAARHLIHQGVDRILVANRTYARALKMAEDFHGTAIEFDHLGKKLQEADIVISSTGALHFVITAEMVAAALRRRKNRLLFLIDIAVPRDVEPQAGEIDNVYLYNIDNLQTIVDENLKTRKKAAEKAEAIIEEEVLKYEQWQSTLELVPTIVSLKEKLTAIVQGEMEKSNAWMQNLNEEDKKNVAIMVNAIINKIVHQPIAGLKEESLNGSAMPYAAALRRLFRLDGNDV
ncbi:MAG: glutamyl-tRNA reductase [Deltaproteobacteria bacterium]|nr:glutamyl-tRNA reductase [Deltaproteobacteria bacterium]